MTIKNVTERASKAMFELSKARGKLSELLSEVKGENLELLFEASDFIDNALQELVKILAQDNQVILDEE